MARVSNLAVVFGLACGLVMATGPAWGTQEGDAHVDTPAEPIVIEIIGDAPKDRPADPGETAPETPAKTPEQPPASDLAPAAEASLAATASTGGSGGTGPGAGSAEPQEKVDPFTGSFSTAVPIAVPPFHGMEPNLALTYNSSRGNGFVGVGWSLSGLSVIERASPGRGAPRHDATDIFLLDGQELVPCVTGTVSPSCDTGGTHATKVESYRRIKQDVASNTWEITGRGGTRTTYSAVMGPNTALEVDTYRWAMTSVVDTHGNTVTYTWWCDGTPAVECYPDTITYNGNTVRLYREGRTDSVLYGTGSLTGRTDYRLNTIDVLAGTDRVRTYTVTYTASATTGRSTVSAIQQFGTDAVLDPGSGSVTTGTSLPATQFGWSAETSGSGTAVPVDQPFTTGNYSGANWDRIVGDFDGDGRSDLLLLYASASGGEGIKTRTLLGRKDGTYWDWREKHPVTTGNYRAAGWQFTVGDINGDGRTDVIFHNAKSSGNSGIQVQALIAISSGNLRARPSSQPLPSGNYGKTGWLRTVGDANGDGMADLIFSHASSSSHVGITVQVLHSNGDGTFSAGPHERPLTHGKFGTSDWRRSTGDVNGDGKIDLIFNHASSSGSRGITVQALLSNGDGTFAPGPYEKPVTAGNYATTGWQRAVGDVNGDGKTDIIFHHARSSSVGITVRALISEGNGSFTPGPYHKPLTTGSFAATGWERALGDVNGDGRIDLLFHFARSSGSRGIIHQPIISRGDGSFAAGAYDQSVSSGSFAGNGWRRAVGDINGDNQIDLIVSQASGATGIKVQSVLIDGSPSMMLNSVTNPLGGTTTVTYDPSSRWYQRNLPMVLQTVRRISTDDGRGNTVTTSYVFTSGLWDAEERRFLGFRSMTTRLPCIAGERRCPHIRTTFRQDRASAGRVAQVERYDSSDTFSVGEPQPLLTRTVEEYQVNDTTPPYTALNTASESRIIVGEVTRRTRVTRVFDAYGNVVEEVGHGDADVTGDEITVSTDYNPNTGDYIVALPARIRSFDGAGTSGPLLTESRILYDDATDWATPPVRGDPTETRDWLDTEARFIASQAEYDSHGNVTATIDPLGRRSETDYDPVYHLYPIASRNPLYFPPSSDTRHQTGTTWDTVCGVPTVSTDLNGNDTTTQYDALCRPTRTDLPDGGFAITSYHNLGDPTAQYVETETPPADGSGNIWGRNYFDGHGRTYSAIAKGPSVGQEVHADLAYNARGLIASGTAPYYAGDPVYTTTYAYDSLNRPTVTTHPDGNWVETHYGVDGVFESVTSYDELGHPVTVHLDAYGQVVRKEEPLGASTTVATTFEWDRLGQLTGITDDAGNQWTYTLDSFGRVITIDDPDLGVWSNAFDDAGQLTTQTDALGQVTRLTYDTAGRLSSKTARDGSAQAEVTTYTYDEAVAGFHNVGALTRAENPAGILRYRYDRMGRETQRIYTIDGSDYTISAGFDIAGRPLWVDYPDGDSVGSALDPFTYDAAGRLTAIPGIISNTVFDAWGNATSVTRANGVVSDYGYSPTRGWLDSLITNSGPTAIQSMTYGRDEAGQITSVASPFADESWTYGYDALRRLLNATNTDTAAHSRTYTYDTVGNMLTNSGVTGTYSYPTPGSPRPHAVTAVGSWSYTYDANGNMLTGAGRTFTYNGENRPTQIDTQAYTYGPDGERWKTVDSAPGGGTTLYLGGTIEIASGVMTKYLPGAAKRVGSPDDPLVETFWLHHDHQGSIQAITDAAGAQVQRFTYYPYGDRIATATAHDESKGWIGERQDATGLFYLHARYYDPVIGRFVSADPSDPLAPGVGLNRYAYAFNTPIMRADPFGLAAFHGPIGDSGNRAKETYENQNNDDDRNGPIFVHDGGHGGPLPSGRTCHSGHCHTVINIYPPSPDGTGDGLFGRPGGVEGGTNLFDDGGSSGAGGDADGGLGGTGGGSLPGDRYNDDRGGGLGIGDVVGIVGEIAVGFIPGSGFVEAVMAVSQGRYVDAAVSITFELPVLKQVRGLVRAFRGLRQIARLGRGNPGRPIHSRYADGTPVYKGEQPPRVSGPLVSEPHSVVRWDPVNGRVYGAKEFGNGGLHPTRDISFTQPTYPNGVPRPGHLPAPTQHRRVPNPTGGTPMRGPEEPLWFP